MLNGVKTPTNQIREPLSKGPVFEGGGVATVPTLKELVRATVQLVGTLVAGCEGTHTVRGRDPPRRQQA